MALPLKRNIPKSKFTQYPIIPSSKIQAQVNLKVDWTKELINLSSGIVTSAATGNPAAALGSLFGALIDIFAPNPTASDPLSDFRKNVDGKLDAIGQDLTKLQESVKFVLQIDTKIQLGIDDLKLNHVLNLMIQQSTLFDRSFSDMSMYASLIISNTTSNSTRVEAFKKLYTLLTSDPNNGPNVIRNALMEYQSHVLGLDENPSVLGGVPIMIQNGWMNCATQKPGQDVSTSFRIKDDKAGPWRDSLQGIWGDCVNSTYSKLQDDGGRKIQDVFRAILVNQLKAYSFLREPLNPPPFLLFPPPCPHAVRYRNS
jgi:hypothetical protein